MGVNKLINIIDGFIDDFKGFRKHCVDLDYSGIKNPQDGITYPDISDEIPEPVKLEIQSKIESYLGKKVTFNYLFIRKSSAGVPVPNIVHSDLEMGQVSLMVYLNELDDCIGGTSFMIHKECGLSRHPETKAQLTKLHEDGNNFDKWQIKEMAEMKPNRAVIFDSYDLHCALPIGGFGSSNKDSRLVLTAFMDIA